MTVHGIVLAAGRSDRFRGRDKLLQLVSGRPVIWKTVSAFTRSGIDSTVVVLPPDSSELQMALEGLDVFTVVNPEPRLGMGASLRVGVSALPADAEAAVIGVADQPLLEPDVIRLLLDSWKGNRELVVAPYYEGRPG